MKTIDDLIKSRESQITRLQNELESLRIAAHLLAAEQEDTISLGAKPIANERPSKDEAFETRKRNQFV